MSFYDQQGWQAPVRQPSWEQPPPPSRSGASSTSQREDNGAFATQFDEVDRAIDNLVKSGKFYPLGPRREQGSQMYGGGMHGPRGRQDRHSNFYAAQRYQGRPSETDQMMQAKRRMAAQRERELRNYHQEQQYNRSVLAEMASNKSDRSMSPSTRSEEGRRDLLARQHRALYGSESAGFQQQPSYGQEGGPQEQQSNNPVSSSGGHRGPSPRGVDPFGIATPIDNTQQGMVDNTTTSPTGHQSGKIPTPPDAEDASHSRSISKSTTAPVAGSMGPIGSRPNPQQGQGQPLNKRTTSPLPAGLGYGLNNDSSNERATSSNSNTNTSKEASTPSIGAWGTGSGVWGSTKIGASVWG